ncbi:hypothetical protein DPX16_8394 [Anabarilius grahami]|uniref:Uncharacterized protein n=1 Tax=Anabarilius grahami TaxID=495550 RepID=A0A3N0Z3E1_ANAGA|nr:hypothetical protein DPX16_8394 [Anabarilius grahami]
MYTNFNGILPYLFHEGKKTVLNSIFGTENCSEQTRISIRLYTDLTSERTEEEAEAVGLKKKVKIASNTGKEPGSMVPGINFPAIRCLMGVNLQCLCIQG